MNWIIVSNKENICEIILNRPDVRNAFNPEMIEEITSAFKSISPEVRVVLLRGEGEIFCSGADLSWMKSMVNYSFEENKNDSLKLYEMFKSIEDCPIPVIAIAQGAAMGGALGMLAVADIVVAIESTKFCFSEVKLGLVPAVISSFVLKKINRGNIAPWMISGKIFNSAEALRLGLVHQVVTQDNLEISLGSWMTPLLEAAPGAVKATKKLIGEVINLDELQTRDKTVSLIADRRISPEGQEGLKSFLEKKAPSWKTLWKGKSL